MGFGSLQHPGRRPGRRRLPPRRNFPAATPFVPTVAGIGASGPIFMLSLETGLRVTLAWGTDIFKSANGNEQRCNTTGPYPKMRWEGSAFLLDGPDREARGLLMRYAAAGTTFLLALPYEALPLSADAAGTVLAVPSTAASDWAVAGQRCIVVGADGTTQAAVVQSTTATTITVGAVDASGSLITVSTLGTTGKAGGRVMPLVQVLLEPQQAFQRYPVGVGLWAIRAQAAAFGWGGQDRCGVGAQIVTYTLGVPVDQSTLVEQDLIVWNRPNLSDETESDGMASLAEIVDLGALPFSAGIATVPDWVRPVRYVSTLATEWQWIKAFLRQVLGRQRAFALPTGRPDLVLVAATGATLKVQSSTTAGGGDYAAWYTSLAHRRLALSKSDGSVQYVAVTAAPVSNNDGTLSLTLDSAVSGTVTMVSFLEQVRFDNGDRDDFIATWDGAGFGVELQARAVQEVVVPPALLMYDRVVDFVLTITGSTPAHSEIVIAAGLTTYVRFTTNRGINLGGIQITNGVQDGMVVTIDDVNNNSPFFSHEDTTWPAAERIWMPNRASVNALGISFTFVYSAVVQRWICIWGSG